MEDVNHSSHKTKNSGHLETANHIGGDRARSFMAMNDGRGWSHDGKNRNIEKLSSDDIQQRVHAS